MATLTQAPQIEEMAAENDNALTEKVYGELIELLVRGGGPEAIVAFRPSKSAHARFYELVEKERSGHITDLETDELEMYMNLEHLLRMAKIRARFYLKAASTPA